MMNLLKTLLVVAISVAFYSLVGTHLPSTGSTCLVVAPLAWLGGLGGYAALGFLTYKGILSFALFSYLSKRAA